LTFSITPASLSQLPEASVAVCAHDAGAASHLAAWLEPLQPQLRLCLAGPAEPLFKERLGTAKSVRYNLEEVLDEALVLISGTGWASDLEHRARWLARKRSIPSVAVLDHWVNYRNRFERDGEEQLPDALWVADSDAAMLAKAAFPNVPVLQLPNQWLDGLCNKVNAIRSSGGEDQPIQPRRPARRLLYLLEPIRIPWSECAAGALKAGEFQGLRYWLQQLPHLIEQGWVAPQPDLEALVLRPHPSEPLDKYDDFITEAAASWPIRLESVVYLEESLAWADAAFGCETQALVVAMACGLHAFSTLPPWAPPCRLPHSSLLRICHMT